jgi:hypothetical protein
MSAAGAAARWPASTRSMAGGRDLEREGRVVGGRSGEEGSGGLALEPLGVLFALHFTPCGLFGF